MREDEVIMIADSKDFRYEVELKHSPGFGFSTAYYKGSIIGQVQLYRVSKPYSDDDREWEMYEERFLEWRDEILTNMNPICKQHFDNQ